VVVFETFILIRFIYIKLLVWYFVTDYGHLLPSPTSYLTSEFETTSLNTQFIIRLYSVKVGGAECGTWLMTMAIVRQVALKLRCEVFEPLIPPFVEYFKKLAVASSLGRTLRSALQQISK